MDLISTQEAISDLFAKENPPKVWAYLRAGSAKVESMQSLEAQRDSIVRFCEDKGLTDVQFVAESAGASHPMLVYGKTSFEENADFRPLFFSLLGHLLASEETTLVIYRLDRLSMDVVEQEVLLELFRQAKVTVRAVMTPDSFFKDVKVVDPLRSALRGAFSLLPIYQQTAQDYAHEKGIITKAAQGKFRTGAPPFGYVSSKGMLSINPVEAEAIRLIFKLYHKDKWTQQKIADYMSENQADGDRTKTYSRVKITKVLSCEEQYRGYYKDCFGRKHFDQSLVILKEDSNEHDSPAEQRSGTGS